MAGTIAIPESIEDAGFVAYFRSLCAIVCDRAFQYITNLGSYSVGRKESAMKEISLSMPTCKDT